MTDLLLAFLTISGNPVKVDRLIRAELPKGFLKGQQIFITS